MKITPKTTALLFALSAATSAIVSSASAATPCEGDLTQLKSNFDRLLTDAKREGIERLHVRKKGALRFQSKESGPYYFSGVPGQSWEIYSEIQHGETDPDEETIFLPTEFTVQDNCVFVNDLPGQVRQISETAWTVDQRGEVGSPEEGTLVARHLFAFSPEGKVEIRDRSYSRGKVRSEQRFNER